MAAHIFRNRRDNHMSAYFTDYPRYAWQLFSGFRANHEQYLAALRERDLGAWVDIGGSLDILDLANGRLRPQYALLKRNGYNVYGVDFANRPTMRWENWAYRAARWAYRKKLAAPMSADTTLICGDVGVLPFPEARFDAVTSIAAFEHFLDVPSVVAELHRVLRPGGVAWLCIHLFTAPSGGHNLSFAQLPLHSLPAGVEPWDHLRQRRLGFHVPLNEWRRDQYLQAIGQHFEILRHYCAIREGEHLLTAPVAAELAEYEQDELTARDYVIVARKPTA